MKLNVNGVERQVATEWRDESLLTVLREQLGLTGSRFSCGIGECGACLVHVDGVPTNSCLMPVAAVADKAVLTIEGLVAKDGTYTHCNRFGSTRMYRNVATANRGRL